MDIHIKNLRLRTIIGIFDWEKKEKQDLIINVRIGFDGSKAQQTDAIDDTLDYKSITKAIIEKVEQTHYNLIEKLVSDLHDLIFNYDKVLWSHVEVDKPGALRFADSVSISDRREKGLS